MQGLAEFLPISSSAHLTLLPWAFGWEDPGLAFDVALHWGTLAAVLFVFWKDWIRIFAVDHKLLWALVVSAVPGAIVGKLLDKWTEENLRAPLLIACTLAVMGVLLWVADRQGHKDKGLAQMTIGRALDSGENVALLVDQHTTQGVDVVFFGRWAKANPLVAQLARLTGAPIRGVRVWRLPDGNHFSAELTEEVVPVRDADGRIDIQATMQAVTNVVEGWVREHPEQWLWLHRRWR